MTDLPTTSRKAAETEFDAAQIAWRRRIQEHIERTVADLLVVAAGDPTALRAVQAHKPFLSGSRVTCLWCVDPDDSACGDPQCCGSPEHVSFPCKELADALAPYGVDPAGGLPARPVWSDFYREPDVTFVLAHHTKVGGAYLPPTTEVTLPLSEARRYRYRMTAESWQAVERLRQT